MLCSLPLPASCCIQQLQPKPPSEQLLASSVAKPSVNGFPLSSQASDSVGPSVRSANLSALKQRWEQPSAPAPAQPVPRCRPPAATRPIALLQGGQLATRPDGWPPAGGQASQGRGAMDSDDLRQKERPEMPEEQVPSSPRGFYAKPRVPLNNLKMKFERGDGAPSKVIKEVRNQRLHKNLVPLCDIVAFLTLESCCCVK